MTKFANRQNTTMDSVDSQSKSFLP